MAACFVLYGATKRKMFPLASGSLYDFKRVRSKALNAHYIFKRIKFLKESVKCMTNVCKTGKVHDKDNNQELQQALR